MHGGRQCVRPEDVGVQKVPLRSFLIGGALTALLLAAVVSQFAVDNPDGLESVAAQTGFKESASGHSLSDAVFADYATAGIGNETVSLAIAGISGVLITLAVGFGLFKAVSGPPVNRKRAT